MGAAVEARASAVTPVGARVSYHLSGRTRLVGNFGFGSTSDVTSTLAELEDYSVYSNR